MGACLRVGRLVETGARLSGQARALRYRSHSLLAVKRGMGYIRGSEMIGKYLKRIDFLLRHDGV